MPAAMRFKSFMEAVNLADEKKMVKGQSSVIVRGENEEEVVAEVLVDDATGNLLIVTKGGMADIVPTNPKKKVAAKKTT
jgi:hypothetical protein